MNQVVIGVGSNINPSQNIELAKEVVSRRFAWIAESRRIKTQPMGVANVADYVNCAFRIETDLDRRELKRSLLEIERELGRRRSADRYAPRPIDLDIVVWNGEIVDPDFYRWDFLRRSVLEVWQDLQDRGTNEG